MASTKKRYIFAPLTFGIFVVGAVAFVVYGFLLNRGLDSQVEALKSEMKRTLVDVDASDVHARYLDNLGSVEQPSVESYGLPRLREGEFVDVLAEESTSFQVEYRATYSTRHECVIASVRGPAPNSIVLKQKDC